MRLVPSCTINGATNKKVSMCDSSTAGPTSMMWKVPSPSVLMDQVSFGLLPGLTSGMLMLKPGACSPEHTSEMNPSSGSPTQTYAETVTGLGGSDKRGSNLHRDAVGVSRKRNECGRAASNPGKLSRRRPRCRHRVRGCERDFWEDPEPFEGCWGLKVTCGSRHERRSDFSPGQMSL